MKTIKDIKYLEGVRVLVRVDFNVPLKKDVVGVVIEDDFRIRMALPTINFLREKGAKVILLAHLETDTGANISLKRISDHMNQVLNTPNSFVSDIKQAFVTIEGASNGDIILLENLRLFPGEKTNDVKFAKELATLGDICVNEAFSVSHRKHASIVGLPKLMPSYLGLQFEKEVVHLSKVFSPAHPFLFILCGAKFETKLPLLEKFINIADKIFVGGALSNDFYKKLGYEVGRSVVSAKDIDISAYLNNSKILLPLDVVDEHRKVWKADKLPATSKIMDAGPETLQLLQDEVSKAKFILWNGSLGLYQDGFEQGTVQLEQIIASASKANDSMAEGDVKVETIVGGGDTVAVISELGNADQFTFVSTGGGAMLDFLARGTLVGLDAVNESVQE